MRLIEQLRTDIDNAIRKFFMNKIVSTERQQNIRCIKQMLMCDNPLKAKIYLTEYIENLSSGFESLLPFLEVNRFKNLIKNVLNLPKYQENAILKALLEEMGLSMGQDSFEDPNKDSFSIHSRLNMLEQKCQIQSLKITDIDQEIKRLKTENEFLCKTISLLTGKNTQLVNENGVLIKERNKFKKLYQELNDKYEEVCSENIYLKNKLSSLFGKSQSLLQDQNYQVLPKFHEQNRNFFTKKYQTL